MIGAKNTAVTLRKATPLYRANRDEKILAALVFISITGPIPVRIIHDIWKLSSHPRLPIKWYPIVPAATEKTISEPASSVYLATRLMN